MCDAYTAHSSLYDFFNSFSIYVYFGWMQLWIVRRLVMLWQIVHLCFWDFQFDSLFFSYVFFCLVLCARCKRCSVKCAFSLPLSSSLSLSFCIGEFSFEWTHTQNWAHIVFLPSRMHFTILNALFDFFCFRLPFFGATM